MVASYTRIVFTCSNLNMNTRYLSSAFFFCISFFLYPKIIWWDRERVSQCVNTCAKPNGRTFCIFVYSYIRIWKDILNMEYHVCCTPPFLPLAIARSKRSLSIQLHSSSFHLTRIYFVFYTHKENFTRICSAHKANHMERPINYA